MAGVDEDRLDDDPAGPERPALAVLWGLLSLVAVTAIVGGVLAVGASYASRAAGLSDDGATTTTTTQAETLYLPPLTEAGEPSEYITLSDVPEPRVPRSTYSDTPAEPEPEITLLSAQTEVGPMEPIDLTGSYVGGEGAILQVQQFEDGAWADFPVTVPVNGDSFTTYVQTGDVGPNRFRVVDTETGEESNEVRIQIG
jgi:hypothetical protein